MPKADCRQSFLQKRDNLCDCEKWYLAQHPYQNHTGTTASTVPALQHFC